MSVTAHLERWNMLHDVAGRIACAPSCEDAIDIVRASARSIAAADGICVVRVVGNLVSYVAEDAIGPLWAGQSFPIDNCISGLAIRLRRPVVIPDITLDARVPIDLYAATFVRSMAMVPLPGVNPHGAIGAYWREPREIEGRTIMLLSTLATALGATFDALDSEPPAEAA